MTKGTSTRRKNRLPGSLYGNFDPGNNDKLMISYRRESSHDYTMHGACGVLFEGEVHFFGGATRFGENLYNYTQQHFVIELQRSGQLVKMTKKEDLVIGFESPSCSTFEMTGDYFPWFRSNVVILCFDWLNGKSCFSFDGKLKWIGFSKYGHIGGGLTKYNGNLLTFGGGIISNNQKTEILKMDENKNFSWSVVEPDFKFYQGLISHSLVTVKSSDTNREYVLLIGGRIERRVIKHIFKFNGHWFPFGKLKKPRYDHNSIYWNDAVYVIGGKSHKTRRPKTKGKFKTKIEIWNMEDSPDRFKTRKNWPELYNWVNPHLFIAPDSFFPDH